MKINKIMISLLVGSAMLTGCCDFLETESSTSKTSQQVFSSLEDAELKINGTYGLLTGNIYSSALTTVFCHNSDVELVDEGKESKTIEQGFRGYMNYRNMDGARGWGNITTLWDEMYKIVEDCNEVIEGVQNSRLKEDPKMQQILGQAYVIRAQMYMELTRMWGDVPFMDSATKADLSNAYKGKTDRDYILDQMLADLEKAETCLKDAPIVDRTHISKYYAKALYAQIALQRCGYAIREPKRNAPFQEDGTYYDEIDGVKYDYINASADADKRKSLSDDEYPTLRCSDEKRAEIYKKAIEKAKDVIDCPEYSLYADFAQLWNDIDLRKDNISESIFEIPMGRLTSSELGYTIGVKLNWSSSEVHNSYGIGTTAYPKLVLPLYESYEHDASTGEAIDKRRDVTCSMITVENLPAGEQNPSDGTIDNDNESVYEKPISDHPFAIYVGKWDARKLYEQEVGWADQNSSVSSRWNYGIHVIRMRLPQVLLYYAELYNELQNMGEAIPSKCNDMTAVDAINKVHKRATGAEISAGSYEEIFNAIVDENMWEFAGEGFRKWDLVRWNLLAYKTIEMKQKYQDNFKSEIYSEKMSYDYERYYKAGENSSSAFGKTLRITKLYLYNAQNTDNAMVKEVCEGFGAKLSNYNKGKDVANMTSNLKCISFGLVGDAVTTKSYPSNVTPGEGGPKNRYLIPLTNDIVNNSNHTLSNSYGY